MPTLEENVNRVKAAKTAIGNAITAKGGTVGANDGLEDFASDIATIPSGGGGGGSSSKDVNFYDYDGTIVNSYTAAEFAELTEMPSNPSHTGLTAQGWNWSLSDAKTYVAANGKLDIGQQYITSDGKTRLYINLISGYTSPTLELYLAANSEVDVDWGDGSAHSTLTSTTAGYVSETHSYSDIGDYVIAIGVTSGKVTLMGNGSSFSILKGTDTTSNSKYRLSLFDVRIGTGVNAIGDATFYKCYALETITLPYGLQGIGNQAFMECWALSSVTIPDGIRIIFGNVFNGCYALNSVVLPNGITEIRSHAFEGCFMLSQITVPSSTEINTYSFKNCYALNSVVLADGVRLNGDNIFSDCHSLSSMTLPTSADYISATTFSNCHNLNSITISSSSSTFINTTAFASCYTLKHIHIQGSTIPSGSPWGAYHATVTTTE